MESLGEWIRWAIGGVVLGIITIWAHITGRLKALEDNAVTNEVLRTHREREDEKFSILFRKHDEGNTKLNNIGTAVARIEGAIAARRGTYRNSDEYPEEI